MDDSIYKPEENADVNEINDLGFSPLHMAVINNDLARAQFLLEHGANIHQRTHPSESNDIVIECECTNIKYCYHVADEYGNEMKDGSHLGQNALHLATKHSTVEIVELLLQSIKNVDERADDESTALHYVAQNSSAPENTDISITELLLKSGADIDARNAEGKTPLYLAVKLERLKLVAYLLSKGANVNISTCRQSTPLFSGLINCNYELTKLLLNNKASITVRNRHDEDLLFFVLRVIGKGNERLLFVNQLLDNGFQVDSRNSYGSTALHIAVQNKDENLAKLLIDRGCSINLKDGFDMSALSIAVCTNLHNLARLLLKRGANVNDSIGESSILEHAVIRRDKAMIQLLFEHSADVNFKRNRPVSTALLHTKLKMMQMLICKGADINYRDKNGRTPLMSAITNKHFEMMWLLLEHGARINEKDNNGNTAIHVLFETDLHTKEHILKYLLEIGADINVENNNGLTPLKCMMIKSFTKGEVFIFIKHIVLLLARDLYVNPKILDYITGDYTWGKYFDACNAEVELMKEIKIVYKYTHYDILTKSYRDLTTLFQAKNVEDIFQTSIISNKFINYWDILRKNFFQKIERSRLIKESVLVLSDPDIFPLKLPPEIMIKLCEHLSIHNMSVYLLGELNWDRQIWVFRKGSRSQRAYSFFKLL